MRQLEAAAMSVDTTRLNQKSEVPNNLNPSDYPSTSDQAIMQIKCRPSAQVNNGPVNQKTRLIEQ